MSDIRERIATIDLLFQRTLDLIALYKSNGLTLPFGLKGNLGEFIVHKELVQRFPNNDVKFVGGAFPGVDLFLDKIRIQVKTQTKHAPIDFKGGCYDFEGSPTIKRSIIDEKKADFIVLVVLYASPDFSAIETTNIYVFDKSDYRFFSTNFCWSGNSKGDYTIFNILSIIGTPPKKLREKIAHYNTPEYKHLFSQAKDNWAKFESML